MTKAIITEKLQDETFVRDALWFLYQRQTEDEKAIGSAIEHNAQGFNATDADYLSQLAKQKSLSIYQLQAARKALPKYWRQLMEDSTMPDIKDYKTFEAWVEACDKADRQARVAANIQSVGSTHKEVRWTVYPFVVAAILFGMFILPLFILVRLR